MDRLTISKALSCGRVALRQKALRPGRCSTSLVVFAALAVLFSASPATAADWPDERRIGRFIVRADFALTEMGAPFAELTALERDVTTTIALPRPADSQPIFTVDVYLFNGEAAYRRHVAQVLLTPPDRRALYARIAGSGRVYAFRSRRLASDLRHECTHALLHASLQAVPLWLDEGLAEYFETPAEQRVSGSPYFAEMRRLATRGGQAPGLGRLERLVSPDEMTIDDYRDAWAWVHFLLHGPPGAKQELIQYISELGGNESPTPLTARLPQRWPKVEQLFLQHFRVGPG